MADEGSADGAGWQRRRVAAGGGAPSLVTYARFDVRQDRVMRGVR